MFYQMRTFSFFGKSCAPKGRIVLISGDRLEIDRARAQALASRWPDAELSWLEGCGHNPIIEAPERLNARLRHLLQTTH